VVNRKKKDLLKKINQKRINQKRINQEYNIIIFLYLLEKLLENHEKLFLKIRISKNTFGKYESREISNPPIPYFSTS
jgi:hypothetical protein